MKNNSENVQNIDIVPPFLLLTVAVYCGFLSGRVPTLNILPSMSIMFGEREELSDVLQSVELEEFDFSDVSSTLFFLFLRKLIK